jgi:hypothetical protein
MGLSNYELEKLADEMYKDRIIRGSTYCGVCGYNLRTLPYIHVCPECGNHYNARPLKMDGIFVLHDTYFPLSELLAALFCGVFAVVVIASGVNPVEPNRLIIGLAGAAIAIAFAVVGYLRLRRFIRARVIALRIAREEIEEEDEAPWQEV